MNCFKALAVLLLTVSLVGCVSLEDVPEVDGTGEHYIDTYTAPEYVEEETKAAEMAIGSTANKSSTSAETITEQVVLDQAGIKITAKAIEKDGWDTGLKVMIENNTDKEITVQARDVCVNGCVIEHTFSSDVTAGMKANDFIRFSESGLERSGITTIADISLKFHIFDGESWDDILDTDEMFKRHLAVAADGWQASMLHVCLILKHPLPPLLQTDVALVMSFRRTYPRLWVRIARVRPRLSFQQRR